MSLLFDSSDGYARLLVEGLEALVDLGSRPGQLGLVPSLSQSAATGTLLGPGRDVSVEP